MKSTALGAENIIFISDAHEKFYYEKLKEVRYQDVYHKALCYCLGISDDTRRNINSIYDFKTGCVKTECLHEGWQTSGSMKVVRMAFNLYCNGTPSVDDYTKTEEQVNECRQYTVEDLFCCAYAPFFWQAIQIRYPHRIPQRLSGPFGYLPYSECLPLWLKDPQTAPVRAAVLRFHPSGVLPLPPPGHPRPARCGRDSEAAPPDIVPYYVSLSMSVFLIARPRIAYLIRAMQFQTIPAFQ